MLSVLHPFWFPHNRHLKGLVDWSACLCSVRRAGLEVCIHHKVLKVTELYLQSSCLVVPSERETLFQGPWSPPTCLSQACTYMLASPVLVFWGERDGKCTQLWFGTSQRHFPGAIDYQRIILQIPPFAKQLHRKFWGMFTPGATFILKRHWVTNGPCAVKRSRVCRSRIYHFGILVVSSWLILWNRWPGRSLKTK